MYLTGSMYRGNVRQSTRKHQNEKTLTAPGKVGTMKKGRTAESVFNSELAKALRTKHPEWTDDHIAAEQSKVLEEKAKRPDILVQHPGGMPVIVETEYLPAPSVEDDARDRVGKKLISNGRVVEQCIALRVPREFVTLGQSETQDMINAAKFEICVYSQDVDGPVRWPDSGWITCDIDELATFIEHASLSESKVAQGFDILDKGIAQAAERLWEGCKSTPDKLRKIADALHLGNNEQTRRVAMAIVANALIFQSAIAGTTASGKSAGGGKALCG